MILLLIIFYSSIFAADLTSVDFTLKRRRSCSSHKHTAIAAPELAAPVPIEIERTISAADFPRWLNARLKYEVCPELRGLSKAECIKPECVIIIHYHGGNGIVRSLSVYDPDHTLMNGEVFTPTDHNLLPVDGIRRGTRHVGFYSVDDDRAFCLKENPEVPALERSAKLLYECLFGADNPGIPNSETILMNGKIFTASSYVKGESFDEIIRQIEDDDEKEHNIFITNLHEMKIFVILAGPEDGRAQNYILQTVGIIDGKTIYRIVSIDNERNFGNATPHPSKRDADVVVRSHSIIHCIPEETSCDYSSLIRALSSRTPKDMCHLWIESIKMEKLYHRRLIPYARIAENTGILSMPITRERFRGVYTRLKLIYEGLSAGETLETLFMQVDQPLAMIYHAASIDSPVTPPKVVVSSDDSTPPSSCLKRIARRAKRADGGRTGTRTPPSASCQLFSDYLPSQPDLVATLSAEALWSPIPGVGTHLSPLPGALAAHSVPLPSVIDSEKDTADSKRRRIGSKEAEVAEAVECG